MNRVVTSVPVMLLLAFALSAQAPPPTYYAESLRQGRTRITEDKFQLNLSPEDANYKQRIRDADGNERYELMVIPKGPAGDNKVTSWQVSLRDLRHSIYGNLLQFDEEPSEDPKDNLWWLNPKMSAPVPIRAKRIIKVDSFYVVMQVRDMHFTPLDSPYLDTMNVQFEFTNSDPRKIQQ